MTWHRVFVSRVRALFAARRLDLDLDKELRFHLEMEIEANLRRGLSPEEARHAALRQFGGITQVAEAYRERRGLPFVETLFQDLRYALRTFRKSPAFTAVAILSLALGIGANTGIFTLADQVMLRRLPVRNPEQLVRFDAPGPGLGMQRDYPHTLSYPMFKAFREENKVFTGVNASFGTEVNLSINGQAERVNCDLVSGNYFQVLGIRPAAGRLLTDDDDRKPGAHPVAGLSYEFWQRRFGGDPAVVGRNISLNQTAMTVVGVSEPGFRGLIVGSYTDVMVPLMMKPQMVVWWRQIFNPRQAWLHVFARLKPGVSPGQAEAAMNVLYHNMLEEESRQITGISENLRKQFLSRRLEVVPGLRGHSNLRQFFDKPLKVLLTLVGLVLLIACANLAGLLSARAAARQTEFAIRVALGAGRGRLIRQLFTESLLLSIVGGAIGLVVAWWTAGSLIALMPFEGTLRAFHAAPDPRAIVFTLAVSTIAALLFGLIPAFRITRPALMPALRSETGASAGTASTRFRKVLVAAQVALALLLTIAAGLFARTLHNLKTMDLGFPKEKLILFNIDPTLNGYDKVRIRSLLDRIEERLKPIPGIRGVAVAGWGPFNSSNNIASLKIEGYTGRDGEDIQVNNVSISPGALAVIGAPVIAGREFTPHDDPPSPSVAIITESMARRYFGGNALGKHIGNRDAPGSPSLEIVGVIRDITPSDPRASRRNFVFEPMRQWDPGQATFHVRTALPPETLFETIRKEVASADPAVPVVGMKTMEVQMDGALFIERMIALLSVCFGSLALILASIGLYGVIAYSVARRTREIGIRMALGAENREVFSLIMKDVGVMLGAGILIGLLCALVLSRLVRAQLYGVHPTDPLTLATAALLLAAVGIAAGFIPARRAIKVDLVSALRYE